MNLLTKAFETILATAQENANIVCSEHVEAFGYLCRAAAEMSGHAEGVKELSALYDIQEGLPVAGEVRWQLYLATPVKNPLTGKDTEFWQLRPNFRRAISY